MIMLVLAGGFGTRLSSVVSDVPKAMAPINGVPLLKLQLDNWIMQGQADFVFLLHHRASLIIDFLEKLIPLLDREINIQWIVEKSPLGTGGSIANAIFELNLRENVLIANADTWLDCGIQALSEANFAQIGVVKVKDTSRYGLVEFDYKGNVTEFSEKKAILKSDLEGIINAGIYKLPASVLRKYKGQIFSLENDVLPVLAHKGLLHAVTLKSSFFDIGVPIDYYQFCDWHKISKKEG